MFITDLAGSVYSARLDGSEKRTLLAAQGNLTGIAYVEIPAVRQLTTSSTTGELIMSFNKPIHRIAIVGTGVIGASWAAQYLARGFDVVATDPAPNAEANLRKYVDEAWGQLEAIGLSPGAIARPPDLHPGHEGGAGAGRPRPGKRPRAARVQDQAVRRHGRRHALSTRSSRRVPRGSRRVSCSRSASTPSVSSSGTRSTRRTSFRSWKSSAEPRRRRKQSSRRWRSTRRSGRSRFNCGRNFRAMWPTACKRRSIERCSTSSSKAC